MIYLIIKKDDLNYLNSITSEKFKEIKTNVLIEPYILITSQIYHLNLWEILKRNSIRAYVLTPYISLENFKKYYPSGLEENLTKFRFKNSYFEILTSDYKKEHPKFDTEFVLLPELQPSIEIQKYLLDIIHLNQKLKDYNLLISESLTKPNLKSVLAESIKDVLIQEANSEVITIKDMKSYNENFLNTVIAEFIIKSNRIYEKKEIKDFLISEFNLESEEND